jgi:hypothetical protein
MFRRPRPPRPPIGLFGFLNPMLQSILGDANRAFENGDYQEAAERYTRLAERAVIRGKTRAGNWLIKAGQANVLAGAKETGMQQIFKGFDLLRTEGRLKDFRRYAWRTIDLFNSHALPAEAKKVSDWVQGISPDMTMPTDEPSEMGNQNATRQRLPSKCPSCGAPVHPETVDWVENGQAACAYCGILLPEG